LASKGLLVVITGPSAVGKGTIVKEALRRYPDLRWSVSVTTRKQRPGETDGVEYFFVSKEEFLRRAEAGELLEWAEVYGNYYGTPRSYIEEVMNQGHDVILDIDINGAVQVRERYPDGLFIFVIPPSVEELKKRIIGRGTESEADIQRRLAEVPKWLEHGLSYQYVLVNDDLNAAVEGLRDILQAEKYRTDRFGKDKIRALLEKGVL
jgi:guanylate kinase